MSRTVVTFNGVDLTALYAVSDLRTSLLPRDISTESVSGRDGEAFTGVRHDTRTITLTLTVRDRSITARQAAARVLAATLAVDEPKPLSISIDSGLYYLAIPSSDGDASRYYNATQFDVTFLCVDPIAYGEEVSVYVGSGGSKTFTVGGTYPTKPVIVGTSIQRNASIGGWKLTLDSTEYVFVPISSATARSLSIDCEKRVVLLAGVVTVLSPDSDWLVIEPGEHTLAMTGTGGVTVTYRERWV